VSRVCISRSLVIFRHVTHDRHTWVPWKRQPSLSWLESRCWLVGWWTWLVGWWTWLVGWWTWLVGWWTWLADWPDLRERIKGQMTKATTWQQDGHKAPRRVLDAPHTSLMQKKAWQYKIPNFKGLICLKPGTTSFMVYSIVNRLMVHLLMMRTLLLMKYNEQRWTSHGRSEATHLWFWAWLR